MKKAILNTLVLVSICAVMTALLAVTNYFTAPIIEANLAAQAGAAMGELLPEGVTAVEVTDPAIVEQYPKSVSKAYTCSNGWSVIEISTKGYSDGLVFLCAVDGDGAVQRFRLVSDNETDIYGGVRLENGLIFGLFTGITTDTLDGVDVHTGATDTTRAVQAAVKDALNTAALLRGEDVDTRTPEEILAANLNAALPAAEGKFSKVYLQNASDIDFVYAADNGTGFVSVTGELFVAVSADGTVITEGVSAEDAAAAQARVTAVLAMTDVSTEGTGINENVTLVRKTAEGNYLILVNGLGFGYFGDPNMYQEAKNIPIEICVLITPDGKILKCLTLSQQESTGYGAVCGEESYYSQFDGKTESDYTDVDVISKATITTKGYMKAIERAFAAVKILEGGSN